VTTGTGAGIRSQKFCGGFRAIDKIRRPKKHGDKTRCVATNCFTHNAKLVNGETS
jgi:hypothetical protein